jgi:hypothetical protein
LRGLRHTIFDDHVPKAVSSFRAEAHEAVNLPIVYFS